MSLQERFEEFQKRYRQIINAKDNQNGSNETFEDFISSKINCKSFLTKPDAIGFDFDTEKQKLNMYILGGLSCNADASDILHYFSDYDEQAIWLSPESIRSKGSIVTKRVFELDLLKVGDKLLDDLELYIKNPKSQKMLISEESKPYIWPNSLRKDLNLGDNKNSNIVNTQPLVISPTPPVTSNDNRTAKNRSVSYVCKFGIFLAIGVTAAVTYQLTAKKTFGM